VQYELKGGDTESPVPSINQGPVLLVVDDRVENLMAMQALLEIEDWRVLTANSGERALRYLLDEPIDLVLLDVQMPIMDGFEVARMIRGNLRTRFTPIIFVSAEAHSYEAVLRGYATGAVDYLLKPVDPNILRHKVRSLLEHERNRRELLQLSQQLELAKAFSDSLLDNAAEGILVVNEHGLITFANAAIARMLKRHISDLVNSEFMAHLSNPDLGDSWADSTFMEHYERRETYRLHDASLCTSRGGILPVTLSCAPLPRMQRAMVMIALDMSMMRELQDQLESQAVTDALTGLLNRRGFNQTLEAALARTGRNGKRMAVLYIDLDGFKKVNDSLGHEAGDRVLCMIAEQLKTCMRPYDVLARMGGDEFTALLDTLDHPEDAARVAEKLLELMTKTHTVDGVEVSLGASIGIASYPECGHSVDGLLRSADIAMYEAKRGGRQQYRFFSPEMNGRARSRLMLEESVRNAIDNKDFVLAYQPQVYLKNGKLRGFEALLRWEHNVAGKVSPNVFIPLLEETRLINRIGDWIFREGAMKLQSLSEVYGNGLLLSINLSPVQFGMPQLAESLRQIIDSYGLRPDQLEIEVTETALMHDIDYTRAQLAQLRALGVRTAVDDFGTGYSSLAYLRHFELDTLKIDQLFIANMLDSPRDAAIVSTILELGRNLGLEVVAEGVETLEQREWLLEHGCEIMQGFLVSKPLNSDVTQHFPDRVDWSSRRPDYPL